VSLHHKNFEKDSCGFGFIAQMDNAASHYLITTAITSLARLSHRGAVDPDGKTGDGCGVLFKKPEKFFQQIAKQNNFNLNKNYAVACVLTNKDKSLSAKALARLDKELRQENLEPIFHREVPIDLEYCGINAQKTLPNFYQVFINAKDDLDNKKLETLLYIVRRKTELALEDKDKSFYISSMSSKLVSYKGMIMPYNLDKFFPDLSDPDMESSLCLYHQRFSTNTFPEWRLAQPFRMLAHNGEINTINGNRNWSISRESKYSSKLIENLHELMPIVSKDGSDSMSLDNMLEGLVATGVDLLKAIKILIPPAWQNSKTMDPELKAMYEYYSLHMDPWDGPAGIVLTDGDVVACAMDRNGLRPARYLITKDGFLTIASEIGVYDYDPANVLAKGRVKPGETLALDINSGKIIDNESINRKLSSTNPYSKWLKQYARYLKPIREEEEPGCDPFFEHELLIYQKQFQLTLEERDQVLSSLANGQEAIGSMGDDTPLAVLSAEIRPLFEYFRQQFAQVTNPPIDPIRESHVMSLRTCLGKEVNPFVEMPENAVRIDINSPILSRCMFKALLNYDDETFSHHIIELGYNPELGLEAALTNICDDAETAVKNGKVLLILTDKNIVHNKIPIHALLAVGAVNARLCLKGLRCDANLILETATARDPHQFATLIGFGATAIYPYLSYQVLYDMAKRGQIQAFDTVKLMQKYREAIEKGLQKILSKMGISTINSYRGAMLFEAIGLHEEVIETCFPGLVSRIQGASFDDLETDTIKLSKAAWDTAEPIALGGLMKYAPNGEYHGFNPEVVMSLQKAVKTNAQEDYKVYTSLVNNRPYLALRDLLKLKHPAKSIDINEVESEEEILKRFTSAAMSIGALSPEAHEALAIAMNKIGGKSNSGEGGEDPIRYKTNKVSRIKQIASARFGVTPEYLINADVLQIKIAQGAKPGEGGQLPGVKVNELIARLRYAKPGTTLISPPPHHDIYSIEDLAQLIFDLKQVNPKAEISVKLVAEPGIGTVAAGVAKTFADSITVAGNDGGTGASPISSIRSAGSPWELGLVETCEVLRANNLRERVKIQADGGIKTGLDVIKAAILGAETFGFGTTLLIALGCKYLRICHLNNCATGVATQNEQLRENNFKGLPERVENFLRFVAKDVREILAYLGYKKLEDIIARTDLLEVVPGKSSKQKNLDLSKLLNSYDSLKDKARFCQMESNPPNDPNILAAEMLTVSKQAIENKSSGQYIFPINNTCRSIGASVSGYIASLWGDNGMNEKPVRFNFKGTAGQSFGVWSAGGLELYLEGDANDYVGKGMAGGKIVIYPPTDSSFESQSTTIIGNTCLYGATGGILYAAGLAGERFAVRNSGAISVVEGIGDNGCEYMTSGAVIVLGQTGINFAAGMTGGFACVYNQDKTFLDKINTEFVESFSLNELEMQDKEIIDLIKNIIYEYVNETKSIYGKNILEKFEDNLDKFYLVKPRSITIKELINDKQCQPFSRTRTN
jgi:glutamate synthase (NADPH/NADH) large chain